MRSRDDPDSGRSPNGEGRSPISEAGDSLGVDPSIATQQERKSIIALIAAYFVNRAWRIPETGADSTKPNTSSGLQDEFSDRETGDA